MLPEPALLPHEFFAVGRESESLTGADLGSRDGWSVRAGVGDVGVPLAPLARRPSKGVRGDVQEIPDTLVFCAINEPLLRFRSDQPGC